MSEKPTLTVGLPVYNGAIHLRETIDSLLAQDFQDFELIISDNGSSDETYEICSGYALKDARVKYLRHEINRGAIWNFNYVFEQAASSYFMWAAHDDVFLKPYVRLCLEAFDSNPGLLLVGTYAQSIRSDTGEILFIDKGFTTTGLSCFQRYVLLKKTLHGGASINGIFYGIYRRQILQQFLPLPNMIGNDHLFFAKLVLAGDLFTVPEPLFIKRSGGASRSVSEIARVLGLKDPLHRYFPYLMLEFYLQRLVFSSWHIPLIERLRISLFSFGHYFYTRVRFLYWCLQGKTSLFE